MPGGDLMVRRPRPLQSPETGGCLRCCAWSRAAKYRDAVAAGRDCGSERMDSVCLGVALSQLIPVYP